MAANGGSPSSTPVSPGQTFLFLGDHTSPDAPGYVDLVREILQRFHPELRLRLITAGAPGQSAAGLVSPEMMALLTSVRPDWLVIGIGLSDALREPGARRLLADTARAEQEAAHSTLDTTFGPELRPDAAEHEPDPAPSLEKVDAFAGNLASAVAQMQSVGVRVCLLTTIVVGNTTEHPANRVVSAYNRVIRQQAVDAGALVVDVERAFRDVIDRAANYQQKVTLTGQGGELNAQGQALIARTLLARLGLLPSGRR